MNTVHHPDPAANCRQLTAYAQKKLIMTNIPLRIRAVSYIRLCCNAQQKSHQSGNAKNYSAASETENRQTQVAYLDLLGQLLQEDSDWWATCYVSDTRVLASTNPEIQQLLQLLNGFVQDVCLENISNTLLPSTSMPPSVSHFCNEQ